MEERQVKAHVFDVQPRRFCDIAYMIASSRGMHLMAAPPTVINGIAGCAKTVCVASTMPFGERVLNAIRCLLKGRWRTAFREMRPHRMYMANLRTDSNYLDMMGPDYTTWHRLYVDTYTTEYITQQPDILLPGDWYGGNGIVAVNNESNWIEQPWKRGR
jgi:hypothetical protein